MLAVENVAIQFGGRTLFKDLSFVVRPKERVSLAGPNGAGKSTLLKIIKGMETPDSGTLSKAKAATVGYLPQEGIHLEGRTLYQEAESAFDDVVTMQRQLHELSEKLGELDSKSEEYTETLEVLGDLQLRLESHDVAKMKPRIEIILAGLGFSKGDLSRDCGEFSGGWQMRIALSKLLLQEPSVLLLDEPTNHLDIESQRWLEQYLQTYHGAIILISHDKSFLDSLTNRTIAFDKGRVEQYAGNYSFYLRERDARQELLERAYKNQQRDIDKQEKLINRFRAKASKEKMVQSRIKALDRVDRSFLDTIVNKTLEFAVGNPPRLYHGNVSYFLEKKEEELAARGSAPAGAGPASTAKPGTRKEQRRFESLRRQEKSRKLQPLQAKLDSVESRISGCEKKKAEMTAQMAEPERFEEPEKAKAFAIEFKETAAELERCYTEWAELSDEIERIEEEFAQATPSMAGQE